METVTEIKNKLPDLKLLNQEDTLLIAIGNSARSDDGLAWAFYDELKKQNSFRGKMVSCYQLQVEDAEMISHFPRVIFVDATQEHLNEGFDLEATKAQNDFTFTTHALTPAAVLFLCNDLYQQYPEAYTLKIKGEDWDLKIGMSKNAKNNLVKAISFFDKNIISETTSKIKNK